MISVDRLKPAHLDFDRPVPLAVPRSRGRSRKLPLLPGSDVPVLAGVMWRSLIDRQCSARLFCY